LGCKVHFYYIIRYTAQYCGYHDMYDPMQIDCMRNSSPSSPFNFLQVVHVMITVPILLGVALKTPPPPPRPPSSTVINRSPPSAGVTVEARRSRPFSFDTINFCTFAAADGLRWTADGPLPSFPLTMDFGVKL